MEVEPDTEYISRRNAVVDRLSNIIKNNFPDDLNPASYYVNLYTLASNRYLYRYNKMIRLSLL